MKPWRIVQHIYEGQGPDPVLTHIFYGVTEDQAERIFRAHLKYDAFMRACECSAHFVDFPCHTQNELQRLEPGRGWVPVGPYLPGA